MMRNVLLVIWHEITSAVGKRSFWVITFLLPLLIIGLNLGMQIVTSLALLLHEFATNAVKYGALSAEGGRVAVTLCEDGEDVVLIWEERGGPPVQQGGGREGFGTVLGNATVAGQLGGKIAWDWNPAGITIRLRMSRERLGE